MLYARGEEAPLAFFCLSALKGIQLTQQLLTQNGSRQDKVRRTDKWMTTFKQIHRRTIDVLMEREQRLIYFTEIEKKHVVDGNFPSSIEFISLSLSLSCINHSQVVLGLHNNGVDCEILQCTVILF